MLELCSHVFLVEHFLYRLTVFGMFCMVHEGSSACDSLT
jgi:hypothetical protein